MNKKQIVSTYYLLDFDDNILHMDTKIIMEKFNGKDWIETPVSTTDFAEFRKNPDYRIPLKVDGSSDFDKAYSNFRDSQENDNKFLNDVIDAIAKKKFAPSYEAFRRCLINGKLFAIVTARGHEPQTIRKAIEYFIDTQLSKAEKNEMKKNLLYYYDIFNEESSENNKLVDDYLSLCEFIGVSSQYFINTLSSDMIPEGETFTPNNTELSKKIAVASFSKRCIQYGNKLKNYDVKIKIGFSDDDEHNIRSITELFVDNLKKEFPDVEFSIFDTSKNNDGSKNYNETVI
jgi:uncharacterized protein YerC